VRKALEEDKGLDSIKLGFTSLVYIWLFSEGSDEYWFSRVESLLPGWTACSHS